MSRVPYLIEDADFFDLLERWHHPLVIGLQLLYTKVQPAVLLLVSEIFQPFTLLDP